MARALPLDPFFRRRCRRAQLILCKTDATREHVPPAARSRAVQMTDVAVGEISVESTEIASRQTPFTFLAVGTLVGWRGLDILVEAFARVSQNGAPVKLLIVGEGPEEAHLRRLIEGAREGSVELLGSRTPAEVHQLMDRADAFVNPCQREGAVTVSFDAIAHSRPIICFDTGGYTHAFRPTFANVLPPCATRQEATRRLEEALLQMADRQRAHQMGQSARQAAAELTWERKGERIRELIRKAYDDAQR